MVYLTPHSIDETLSLLGERPATILAGGTDVYPGLSGRDLPGRVIDISSVNDLRGVSQSPDGVRIGALTSWSDIRTAALPPAFSGLRAAAGEVGGRQIQNAGTIAGNLCNASPAADGVPPLLTLDASVELASLNGRRQVDLSEFLLGPRKTARRPSEIVTAVVIPHPPDGAVGAFEKLGARRYLVISVAMVAALVGLDDTGRIAEARIAVGACSPVALRLNLLEADIVGKKPAEVEIDAAHLADLAPITDPRGTGEYRTKAVPELIRRAIRKAGGDIG